MKNHFIMAYFGNKRIEVEMIYDKISDEIEKSKIIIEPFCGSCAMSYYISLKHPKKFKYIINDNNTNLIKLLNILKDENEWIKFREEINEILKKIIDKESYLVNTKKDTFTGWFIGNKYFSIRPFLYNTTRKIIPLKEHYPIIDFLRNEDIEILNTDGCLVYNDNKFNSKTLILLDPPYLLTDNRWYSTPTYNIYETMGEETMKNLKAKIVMIVNNNFIMRFIYKKWYIIEYDAKYQTTKKELTHLIISNIKKNT